MKNVLIILLLLECSALLHAQNKESYFYGKVICKERAFSIAHISNLSNGRITITDVDYNFKISSSISDTLLVSSMGFKSQKVVVSANHFNGKTNIIVLTPKVYELSEMIINPYGLTGILEVDVKSLTPKKRKKTLKIPGFKTVEELGFPKPKAPNVFQIVDFLYDIFSSRGKQMRKLKELKASLELERKLQKRFDRKLIMRVFKISKKELDELLGYCSYTTDFILKASDIEIIDALSKCYDDFLSTKTH